MTEMYIVPLTQQLQDDGQEIVNLESLTDAAPVLTIPMHPLSDDDILLLIFNALQSRCQLTDFVFHWGNVACFVLDV
jgi:hypothetical protein